MNREDMEKVICSILLLLSLTSCVSGAFTRTSYEAEENHNITMEWIFSNLINRPLDSYIVYCEMPTDDRRSVLFHLHKGVEVPESQDEQFTGRVRWDKDVLRDGRIRLHMSRLRINDSGRYRCDMDTGDDRVSRICHLNVTAAADEPKPPRPTMRPQPESPTMRPQPESLGRIYLYVGLGAALLVLCTGLYFAFLRKRLVGL
ncbi:uncharacterized protein LOC119481879 isoform X7 [Sebastes umbrosus]|uniref:uncharacterized protein LOC119481879 isoform X7 n=1 Tax=Sebastes umbrosus TaxID=72105 RepID=UPI00189E8848|nr:uncharacterized protein LOC119481879 isoform X7 [Sebastes umbrosus]